MRQQKSEIYTNPETYEETIAHACNVRTEVPEYRRVADE